ncbi:MAG TPA: acyl carrier protein [Actinomycetota bacterium]|nr:acyl carrier protein [Actinomycetota bacterium]
MDDIHEDEFDQEIMRFVLTEVLEDEHAEFPSGMTLIGGLLDSFALMQLLAFLEERYAISISNNEVVKRNFRSVPAVAEFVRTKLAR